MKTTPTPKPPKPSRQQIEAELAAERVRNLSLQTELETARGEIAGYRAASGTHADEVKHLQQQVRRAKEALEPFVTKTAKWQWPADGIEIARPLTFGDVRKARDAATDLGRPLTAR